MRVMVLVKANRESEGGKLPGENELAEMGAFNEELVKAGVMLAGEGLHPSSEGVRMRFDGSSRTVVHGPFGSPDDLVAGFWIWKVSSLDEAISWLERAPFHEGEVELRQVFETEDFAASDPSGEHRRREEQLRSSIEGRQGRGAERHD